MKLISERLNNLMFTDLVSVWKDRESFRKTILGMEINTYIMCASDGVDWELRLQTPPQSGVVASLQLTVLIEYLYSNLSIVT